MYRNVKYYMSDPWYASAVNVATFGAVQVATGGDTNVKKTVDCHKKLSTMDVEIALVVDSTGSMNYPTGNWKNTKQWMKDMIDLFEIDGQNHRVGLIRWSNRVYHESTVLFDQNLTGKCVINSF